jgi:hypothetical protein
MADKLAEHLAVTRGDPRVENWVAKLAYWLVVELEPVMGRLLANSTAVQRDPLLVGPLVL